MVACALLSVAALIVGLSSLNADSAWLLVAAERWLDGVRPYVALGETNPPLVVWLHTVPVMLARVMGVSSETGFVLTIWALSLWSMVCLWRQWPSRWVVLMAYALGPMAVQVYGQREHLLLLLAAPFMLSLLPWRVPRLMLAVPAAVGLCLKPYFLLWPVAWLLLRLFRQRQWRAAFNVPVLLLGVLIAAYALYLFVIDRNYVETVLPDLLRYYDAFIAPGVLQKIAMLGALFMLPLVFYMGVVPAHRWGMAVSLVSGGAALLMLWLQQKGWANHWYPFLVAMLVANMVTAVQAARDRERFVFKLVMILAAINAVVLLGLNGAGMLRMVQHEWPPHAQQQVALLDNQKGKTFYTLSFDMNAAFPSSLQAGKRLVGQYPHQWFLAKMVRDRRTLALPQSTDEAHYFCVVVDDFVTAKPELVVVTKRDNYYHPTGGTFAFDFIAYYSQDPVFKRAWKRYQPVGVVGPYHYYRRGADTR